jgi:hypothetical protein
MNASIERIAVIQGAPGAVIQDLFRALAGRLSLALRVTGVVAESHGLTDRRCSAGYLRHVASGKRFSIFEDLGPGSTACHLEGNAVALAAEAVQQDLAAGCDLVLLSKFGKLESGGQGLVERVHCGCGSACPAVDLGLACGRDGLGQLRRDRVRHPSGQWCRNRYLAQRGSAAYPVLLACGRLRRSGNPDRAGPDRDDRHPRIGRKTALPALSHS